MDATVVQTFRSFLSPITERYPCRHMKSKQRCINFNATSRRRIDVDRCCFMVVCLRGYVGENEAIKTKKSRFMGDKFPHYLVNKKQHCSDK